VDAATITDADILNFALNLEYLEAEFYTVAVTGKYIEDSGIPVKGGTNLYGPTTGGAKVNFNVANNQTATAFLQAVAEELMYDEQTHVKLIQGALGGGKYVNKPKINLDALGIGFANFQQFLALGRAFEDTGVSAYGGAAPLITSKEYLATAVQIGLVEALHAGNLRLLIAATDTPTSALDSMDVLPPPSGKQFFTADSNALAIVRTTSEVLSIVYAKSTSGTNRGGFFPDGVNGPIHTV
jgi:hypothetical protein